MASIVGPINTEPKSTISIHERVVLTESIDYVNSEQVPAVPPLSHATCFGNLVFVSGQVGLKHGDRHAPELFADEVENAFAALENVLLAADSSLEQIVKANCYLADISDRDELNELYMQRFSTPRPARTTVEVGLAHGLRFEIDAIATRTI